MEEYETNYDLEEPADQEEVITEPEPEDPEQGGPDPEEGAVEEPETDPAEEPGKEGSAEGEDETGTDPEEGTGEEPVQESEGPEGEIGEPDPETVSGNDLTVSGNDLVVSGDVIVFPEGCDLSALGGEPADTGSIVQAVERQTDVMIAGFACTCFMLGILAGVMLIAGFRLRRV